MQYSLIRWILLTNTFYVFLILLRQITLEDTISPVLYISQFFLIFLIVIGYNVIKFTIVEFLLLLLLLIAILKADYNSYKISNIFIDFIKPIIFIGVISSIRNAAPIFFFDKSISKIFKLYAINTIISVLIGISYYFIIGGIYPAYSTIYSLLGYFYLLPKSKKLACWFLVVLLLSGKRGVLLSGLFAQLIVANPVKLLKTSIFVGLFLLIIIPIFMSISNQSLENWIAENILKINVDTINSMGSLIEVIKYISGGRLDELFEGFNYDFSIWDIIFGKSLGYTYESPSFNESDHKNFHFSPASLLVNYGLIFTLIFIAYIFNIIFNDKIKNLAKNFINAYIIRMYLISSLFFFFTEYGVFTYVNFCIGLGLLAGGCRSYGEIIKLNSLGNPIYKMD